ncbi:AAA family ATPase [Prevotella sp. E2-28]|uniref:AAA family ATPase n=1 Tax=Prevotella sp. E2-28 TaxID=2913620 RepID=UPI001EDC92FD|nr:AAA family ATPase [Prevotella sp. E2-28]UKK55212.1 AAA family ATPase [Prevotella sp. E2-28]
MKDRILSLLGTINKGIYEKETELSLSLMAALAGESVILLGPPGVAKSMVARRLKLAFKDARSFEYLMSRFSTPDEIFGPVSIRKLKDADKYERNTEGYLPTADVVFLDEIWKAGPAIQNTLLTVINEKLFRNGDTEVHLPLKLLLAASNELPTQGEGLEALWDRFIIRIECGNIKDVKSFNAMLLDNTADGDIEVADGLQITDEEYCQWNKAIDTVAVSEEVLRIINVIRKSLGSVTIAQTDERHNVYVSDRRWKKIVRLLRTSAFVHDRTEVTADDLLPVYNCLWQEPEECEGIRAIVIRALYNDLTMLFASLRKNLENDIRVSRQHRATNRARQNMQLFDTNKKIYDNYYYHLLDHDTGNTYVLVADYQNMRLASRENAGQAGIIYKDPNNPQRSIIRTYDGSDMPRGASSVYLTRDEECIYINGVRFYIETLGRGEQQTLPTKKGSVSGRDFYEELEQLSTQIRQRTDAIHGNIFVSEADKKEVDEFVKNLFTEIAHTRQDMEKLEE